MIQLESDFSDYYDAELQKLDNNSTLTRWNKWRANKPTQYKILKSYGINTPLFGTPKEVFYQLKAAGVDKPEGQYVVVWIENAIDPLRVKLSTALSQYENEFVVEYVIEDDRKNVGQSVRCLYVGSKVYAYEMTNRQEYRSIDDEQWLAGKTVNGGIVRVDLSQVSEIDQVDEEGQIMMNDINTIVPIYRSDIVERNGELYAVNFNSAPSLKGTPFQNAVPAEIMALRVSESLKLSELIVETKFS